MNNSTEPEEIGNIEDPVEVLVFNHGIDCKVPGCWNRGHVNLKGKPTPCKCLVERAKQVVRYRQRELTARELDRIMRRAGADEKSKQIKALYQERRNSA